MILTTIPKSVTEFQKPEKYHQKTEKHIGGRYKVRKLNSVLKNS
jgi:fructose-1,6-bisphosphatase